MLAHIVLGGFFPLLNELYSISIKSLYCSCVDSVARDIILGA